MKLSFPFLALISLLLSPILYLQSIRVRKKVPVLPEAANPSGYISNDYNNDFSLLVLGESTMAGVGIKDHKDGFGYTLADKISNYKKENVHWEVKAKSGYTAKQLHDELIPSTQMKDPDLIVIGTGANDAFSLNPPTKFARDISKCLTDLKSLFPNTNILFINMPPIPYFPALTKLMQFCLGQWVRLNGEKLIELSDNNSNVYYIQEEITPSEWFDKYENYSTIDDMFSDGVHPSKKTYQLWANECFNYILEQKLLD